MGALLTLLVTLELVKGVMGIGAADRPLYTRGKGNCEANQEVFWKEVTRLNHCLIHQR